MSSNIQNDEELRLHNEVSDLVRDACLDAVNDVNAGYSFSHGFYSDKIMQLIKAREERLVNEARIDEQNRTFEYNKGGIYVRGESFEELTQKQRIAQLTKNKDTEG